MIHIAPSILAADFSRLGAEIQDVEKAGADWLHIDIMDGHFVPNISFGPVVLRALRPLTTLPFDVHLMISNPDQYMREFVEAGADRITIHAEATLHLHRSIGLLRDLGVKVGVALNPATPLVTLEHIMDEVDLILIMTVNPGFGGQNFIDTSVEKIKRLRDMLEQKGLTSTHIQVDGGINPATSQRVRKAGADVLVAGSAVFSVPDRVQAIASLRGGRS